VVRGQDEVDQVFYSELIVQRGLEIICNGGDLLPEKVAQGRASRRLAVKFPAVMKENLAATKPAEVLRIRQRPSGAARNQGEIRFVTESHCRHSGIRRMDIPCQSR
jgi:hypothetical protein